MNFTEHLQQYIMETKLVILNRQNVHIWWSWNPAKKSQFLLNKLHKLSVFDFAKKCILIVGTLLTFIIIWLQTTTLGRIWSTFSENIQLNALTRPGYQLEAFYLEVVVGAICNLQPEIGKIGQKSFSSIIICVSQKNILCLREEEDDKGFKQIWKPAYSLKLSRQNTLELLCKVGYNISHWSICWLHCQAYLTICQLCKKLTART